MKNYERTINMINPYTLTFGKKPPEYIVRRDDIEEIEELFLQDPPRSQSCLIRGVRGSGKTVLMTVVSKEISERTDWICVDLNSSQNLLDDLSFRLIDACNQASDILDRGFDFSVAGFGFGVGEKLERDSVSRCEDVLNLLKKKNKKLLITIDEVYNNQSMKQLANQFQIWLRKDYQIFLLMTGIYENINAIQNDPQITFLLRSPKITLNPLSLSQIARQYEKTLNIDKDFAIRLAKETKGYAFAFQVLGLICFDERDKSLDEKLDKMDEYLDEFVYQKIWSGLSKQDRNVLMQLSDNQPTKVEDICKAIQMTSASFSRYRARLIDKGLIIATQHGYIELALPRFKKIIAYYEAL